jgi:hypothetical protein
LLMSNSASFNVQTYKIILLPMCRLTETDSMKFRRLATVKSVFSNEFGSNTRFELYVAANRSRCTNSLHYFLLLCQLQSKDDDMAADTARVTDRNLTLLEKFVDDAEAEADERDVQNEALISDLQRRNEEALQSVARWLDSIRLQMSTPDVVLEPQVDDDMKVTLS